MPVRIPFQYFQPEIKVGQYVRTSEIEGNPIVKVERVVGTFVDVACGKSILQVRALSCVPVYDFEAD